MNRNDEPNTDKDRDVRADTWRGILAIYGLLVAALLWNWLV